MARLCFSVRAPDERDGCSSAAEDAARPRGASGFASVLRWRSRSVSERRHDEQQLFRERSRDRAARNALIERSPPLARSLARRSTRGAEPIEDLEQVASLALIRAIDTY